jgi:hypothetical protein
MLCENRAKSMSGLESHNCEEIQFKKAFQAFARILEV